MPSRLDDGPASPYWIGSYLRRYDHDQTFLGYLGRRPKHGGEEWERDLKELRDAIPAKHREFLVSLPWVVEVAGSLILALRAVDELAASATEQLAALHRREWDRSALNPSLGYRHGLAVAAGVPGMDRCPQSPVGVASGVSGQGSGHGACPGLEA